MFRYILENTELYIKSIRQCSDIAYPKRRLDNNNIVAMQWLMNDNNTILIRDKICN